MPTLTYAVLRDLASILSVFIKVKLITHNSEPYVRSVSRLGIHVVEELSSFPWPTYSLINRKELLIKDPSLAPRERREIDGIIKGYLGSTELLKELMCLASSIQYGLPLITYSYYVEPNIVWEVISNLMNLYEGKVSVEYVNKLVVHRRLGLGNSLYELIKVAITSTLLKKITGISRKTEVSTNELRKIINEVFSRNHIIIARISKDIYEIEKNTKELSTQTWIPYREIYPQGTTDLRNFIAHSGLLANHIEVKKNTQTYIRYNKEQNEEIIKLCINSLNQQ